MSDYLRQWMAVAWTVSRPSYKTAPWSLGLRPGYWIGPSCKRRGAARMMPFWSVWFVCLRVWRLSGLSFKQNEGLRFGAHVMTFILHPHVMLGTLPLRIHVKIRVMHDDRWTFQRPVTCTCACNPCTVSVPPSALIHVPMSTYVQGKSWVSIYERYMYLEGLIP